MGFFVDSVEIVYRNQFVSGVWSPSCEEPQQETGAHLPHLSNTNLALVVDKHKAALILAWFTNLAVVVLKHGIVREGDGRDPWLVVFVAKKEAFLDLVENCAAPFSAVQRERSRPCQPKISST